LDLRDARGQKGRVGRGPYNRQVPGEVFSHNGEEDRAHTSLLLREVALILRAGLVLCEAVESRRDPGHITAFERAYREVSHLGDAIDFRSRHAENRLIAEGSISDGWLCRRR
jgi:hypothetical protein